MDIFRIFDCFNDISCMDVSIKAVRAANKVAEVCVCYTGNMLTSKIYHSAYYRSVADAAVKAGAHIIGIKDMAGLLRPNEVVPLLTALREVMPPTMPIHFHTHATSSGSIATCLEMARNGCDVIDVATASMADGTSQPSLNAFVAMLEGSPNETPFNFLDLEPYDMYWARVRLMYSDFESGMLSGSARVYEHQIPGGQYSNLLVQCRSMGLWDRWEEVLDAYRDANRVLGDIVKVTPSSKCVGDLALYLVTRNLTAADLLDESKAGSIDFPESVVGLFRGDLGFPHLGFPADVERAVLRGNISEKRTVRAGLTLPAQDLDANISTLSEKYGYEMSPEEAMSSLMYPKVFSDFMKRQQDKGGELLRYLPSPVYFHGMMPGQHFTMNVPSHLAKDVTEVSDDQDTMSISIQLDRVAPKKKGHRELFFTVNGVVQCANVKDSTGVFVFEGAMANLSVPGELGSPMPGVVEKVLVSEGVKVAAGDTLVTVSAMKMEVKVTAPFSGYVKAVHIPVGDRVVEGALLITLTQV
jgi:pyruvate carboxylase